METPRKSPDGGASDRNVKRRRQSPSSSGSSSGADDGLFISTERKARFERAYRRREIINGSRVEFHGFEAGTIGGWIKTMGWTPMITMDLPVYPRLVRLFYCNLESNPSETSITSLVNGTVIRLDCGSLAAILGIPNEGIEHYPGADAVADADSPRGPSAGSLSVLTQRLFDMLVSVFVPRRHHGRPSEMDKFLLRQIEFRRRERVNLCYIIIRHMMEFFWRDDVHLPYGMLLTKIFNSLNVAISPEEEFETMSSEFHLERFGREGRIRTFAEWRPGTLQHHDDEEHQEVEMEDEGRAEKAAMEGEGRAEEPAMVDEGRGEEPVMEDEKRAVEPVMEESAMEDERRAEEPAMLDEGGAEEPATETDSVHDPLRDPTVRVDSAASTVQQDPQSQRELEFANLNESLGKLTARVDSMDNKLTTQVDSVAQQVLTNLNESLSKVAARVDSMDSKLNARVDTVASAVQTLQSQQEKRFADLNSKLDSLIGYLNYHFCPYPPPPTPFDG